MYESSESLPENLREKCTEQGSGDEEGKEQGDNVRYEKDIHKE